MFKHCSTNKQFTFDHHCINVASEVLLSKQRRENKESAKSSHHPSSLIENANREKCESFINESKSQRALSNDQFLKKCKEAVKVLSNLKTDQSHFDEKKKKKQKANEANDDANDRSEKREDENETMTFANMKGSCHCCEKKKHLSTSCQQKETLLREQ